PEPSISVIPSPNVALGGNFYISCGSHHYKATFELFKGEPAIYVRSEKSSSYTVDFFISEAKLEHGGIYQCRYCLNRLSCSNYSDEVHIKVTGKILLSKPSIKVLPNERISPGQNITIECQGPEKGLNFSLYKSGELITSQVTESERNRAEFPFFNVGLEDEGNYTCQYHRRGNPFAWSEPSNATELVVRGQLYPKPSISAVSTNVVSLGGKIILRCASDYHQDVKYYLHKDPPILYSAYWNSEWGAAVFQIANARASDGGTYTCSYSAECVEEYHATSLHTILTVFYLHPDSSLSKPSIKVLPDERISPGQNITIECQGPEKGLNFSLYKSGELITSQVTESERNRAEFPFFNVGLEDEGNYTCQYHRRGNPFAWSEPSNATELVVRGEKIGWVLVFPLPSKSHSLLWRRQEEEGTSFLVSVCTTSLKAGEMFPTLQPSCCLFTTFNNKSADIS
uniref:Ig-like domain-containing protein n=1 Tax=Podarcis muralis TaxID=64176 RepID=A0A670JWB2_PODMU